MGMDEKEQLRENRRRLKALIMDAGFVSTRLDQASYMVAFTGKLRDWSVRCHIYNGWLCFSAYVMQLPEGASARAALLERLLRLNAEITVAKFSLRDDALKLELESRAELVDSGTFNNLMWHFYQTLESRYLPLARLAGGEETLDALQTAFQRPSLTGGAE